MSSDRNPARRVGLRTMVMTGVAVVLILSALAWFNAGDKAVGLVQLAIGGLLGTAAILYGRLSRR